MTHPRNPNSPFDEAITTTGTTVASGEVFFDAKGDQVTYWTIPEEKELDANKHSYMRKFLALFQKKGGDA